MLLRIEKFIDNIIWSFNNIIYLWFCYTLIFFKSKNIINYIILYIMRTELRDRKQRLETVFETGLASKIITLSI